MLVALVVAHTYRCRVLLCRFDGFHKLFPTSESTSEKRGLGFDVDHILAGAVHDNDVGFGHWLAGVSTHALVLSFLLASGASTHH